MATNVFLHIADSESRQDRLDMGLRFRSGTQSVEHYTCTTTVHNI